MEQDFSTLIELRSRNRGGTTAASSNSGPTTSGWVKDDDRVYIEHTVQPTDNLYKIGLQYSVPVSEIKRVNNIVADQEVYGLKLVRVPITRLRQQFLNEKRSTNQQEKENNSAIIDLNSPSKMPEVAVSDKLNLLGEFTDDDNDGETNGSDKADIKAYLNKADTTVAHCRNQLPSPSLESGAFHFVNASAPDNAAKGTWMLVLGVVLMFIVVPLFLTLLEEKHEAYHQIHHQFTSST